MSDDGGSSFPKYLALRDEVDKLCSNLYSVHSESMLCKSGCDDCCMNFGILSIEFSYILSVLKAEKHKFKRVNDSQTCPFLIDHQCSIYIHRPLICRTHGYPILQMGESELELTFCHLNFKEVEDSYFQESDCFGQDLYNSKLYMLNQEFVENTSSPLMSENVLYPLGKLVDSLEDPVK